MLEQRKKEKEEIKNLLEWEEKQRKEKIERLWGKTLTQWKTLSEMPDQKLDVSMPKKGLPLLSFCEEFWWTRNCPLGDCSKEEQGYMSRYIPCLDDVKYYQEWKYKIVCSSEHDQRLAKGFYKFLLKKRMGRK